MVMRIAVSILLIVLTGCASAPVCKCECECTAPESPDASDGTFWPAPGPGGWGTGWPPGGLDGDHILLPDYVYEDPPEIRYFTGDEDCPYWYYDDCNRCLVSRFGATMCTALGCSITLPPEWQRPLYNGDDDDASLGTFYLDHDDNGNEEE